MCELLWNVNTDCRLSLVGVLLTFTQRGANKSETIVFTFSKNFSLVCEKASSWNVYGQAPLALALSAGDNTQLPIIFKLDGKSEMF